MAALVINLVAIYLAIFVFMWNDINIGITLDSIAISTDMHERAS